MLLLTILSLWNIRNGHCHDLDNETFPDNSAESHLKIVPSNITLPRAGYGLIQFEGHTPSNFVNFDDNGIDGASNNAFNARPFKFEENDPNDDKSQDKYNQNHIKFENDKKKKRRRRKPKQTNQQTSGISRPGFQYDGGGLANNNPDFGLPNLNPGVNRPDLQYNGQISLYPHLGGPLDPNSGFVRPGPQYNGQYNFNPGFGGPYNPNSGFVRPGSQNNGVANLYQGVGLPPYRPQRRPRPSLASQALSSVTGALTSIAAYDDYQCVPRLLCEAAGGGALGNTQIIQSASKLQPLLTVLSAYSGISTNPLFVFGRAVFLGASSKENPGSCRYAYPQCPTDPEQLVHYLNNHNGGFFRFFNAPQQGQQNLEQFYNQLSQNYGLYQLNQIPNQNGLNAQNQQNYGFYRPSLYPMGQQQNYGYVYPYFNNDNQVYLKSTKASNEKENEIEDRILNKPDEDLFTDFEDEQSKWAFPDIKESNSINNNDNYNIRDAYNDDYNSDARKGKALKFPEQENNKNNLNNFNRNVREFVFPENQFLNNYNDFSSTAGSGDRFVFTSRDTSVRNEYNIKMPTSYFDDASQTVYVVRGNGDPNKPEIIKLKPGQSVL